MPPEHAPPELSRDDLPTVVRDLLNDGERVLYCAQPIRRAGGIGVWMIMSLGVLFVPAAAGALSETYERARSANIGVLQGTGLFVLVLLEALFAVFALILLVWPWLSERARKHTHVAVTDERVLELRQPMVRRGRPPRLKEWPVSSCEHAAVARRRPVRGHGESATLVLRERVRTRKSDGKPVYEWDALHGLPRADDALYALEWARAQKLEPAMAELAQA